MRDLNAGQDSFLGKTKNDQQQEPEPKQESPLSVSEIQRRLYDPGYLFASRGGQRFFISWDEDASSIYAWPDGDDVRAVKDFGYEEANAATEIAAWLAEPNSGVPSSVVLAVDPSWSSPEQITESSTPPVGASSRSERTSR